MNIDNINNLPLEQVEDSYRHEADKIMYKKKMTAKIILFDDNKALLNMGTFFFKNVDDAFIKEVKKLDCPYQILDYCRSYKSIKELDKQPTPKYDVEIDFRDKIDIDKAIEMMHNR